MNERTLDEGFERLEAITKKLESKDISLEEQFDLYKEGMALVKECSEKIDLVEKKMITISSGSGNGEE